MFSERTSWNLTPNELSIRWQEIQKKNSPVFDLTESNPTHCGFKYPSRQILRKLSSLQNILYEPSALGGIDARKAIAGYYRKKNFAVNPGHIFLTASTSEAYSVLFRLLTNPGDEVLAPRPSYPLFEFLATLNDIRINYYPLVYQDGWRLNLSELEGSVTQSTKAVILVNPNNPTGSFLRRDEIAEINEICRRRSIALICDEVFLDYYFPECSAYARSLADNHSVLTFTLGGIAKSLGLPQMKLGWGVICGPADLAEESLRRLEIILDTYLSVNTPVQNCLRDWLPLGGILQKMILKQLLQNREFLKKSLSAYPFCQSLAVEGGWYAILRLPGQLNEEEWALEFLEKDCVFVHPGYFFDFEEGTQIVISLLTQPKIFREGLRRILERVKRRSS